MTLINESVNEMSGGSWILSWRVFFFFFFSEVRREDGQEYSGETLCEMIGTIQTSLRVRCERNVTLMTKKVLHIEV